MLVGILVVLLVGVMSLLLIQRAVREAFAPLALAPASRVATNADLDQALARLARVAALEVRGESVVAVLPPPALSALRRLAQTRGEYVVLAVVETPEGARLADRLVVADIFRNYQSSLRIAVGQFRAVQKGSPVRLRFILLVEDAEVAEAARTVPLPPLPPARP